MAPSRNVSLIIRSSLVAFVGATVVLVVATFFFSKRVWGVNLSAQATWTKQTQDFGSVDQGPILTATFEVQNTGGRRLLLNRKSSDCECSSRSPSTIVIPAGETRAVVASLDTNAAFGCVVSQLSYSTNDPQSPEISFTLKANVGAGHPVSVDSSLALPGRTAPEGHSPEPLRL